MENNNRNDFTYATAPRWYGTGSRGALLLHGFSSTPQEMHGLGTYLATNGWRCYTPLLTGHGTTPEDLETTTWHDWVNAAREALELLSAECSSIVVAGESMGAAIALHLAATELRISAIATLSVPLRLPGLIPYILPLGQHIIRWHIRSDKVDLYTPEAIDFLDTYSRRPVKSVYQLDRLLSHVRRELAYIRAPVLILHGCGDQTVPAHNSRTLERSLVCSASVKRISFMRSGHALAIDIDHVAANEEIQKWFDYFSYRPSHPPTPSNKLLPSASKP